MKAILIKDFLTSKALMKNYFMILLIYLFVAYVNQNIYMFSGLMLMVPVMMTINAVGYDEKSHTERYLIASGISRKHLALSKYVFAMCLLAISVLLNILVVSFFDEFAEAIIASLVLALVSMAYLSALLPILYKFGTEKARIYMMLGFLIPVGLAAGLSFLTEWFAFKVDEMLMVWGLIVLCFFVIVISIKYSILIFEKKDV